MSMILLVANCEFLLHLQLQKKNLYVLFSTVRGRPAQLLDSIFGRTSLNTIIKPIL